MHFLTIVIGENPDGQLERCRRNYDWYQFGGRWTGHLILKPGRRGRVGSPGVLTPRAGPGRADQATKGDICFPAMVRENLANRLAAWDELARRGKTSDPVARSCHDIPESCRTREEFVAYSLRRSAHCAPSAVVHRARWFGPWWLSHGPTEPAADEWDAWYSALLAGLPGDARLTVVDCHV